MFPDYVLLERSEAYAPVWGNYHIDIVYLELGYPLGTPRPDAPLPYVLQSNVGLLRYWAAGRWYQQHRMHLPSLHGPTSGTTSY